VLSTAYVACGVCTGPVDLLTRPGSDVSFPHALRGALWLPVGLPGLLLLLALAVVASELDSLAEPTRSLSLLAWSIAAWTAGMALIRSTADGAATLADVPAAPWRDLVGPAIAAAVLTAPALLVPRSGLSGAATVAAGALVLTPLLLAVAGRPSGEALLNRRALRGLWALKADGALSVACIASVWLFAWMLGGLAASPRSELQGAAPVPPLWGKSLAALGALTLFLVPRVLGLLIGARGDDFAYRFRIRGAVPVLPEARPEKVRAYRRPEPPPRIRPQPIAVDDSAAGRLELEPFAGPGAVGPSAVGGRWEQRLGPPCRPAPEEQSVQRHRASTGQGQPEEAGEVGEFVEGEERGDAFNLSAPCGDDGHQHGKSERQRGETGEESNQEKRAADEFRGGDHRGGEARQREAQLGEEAGHLSEVVQLSPASDDED
jgi:hypothetical protein